METTAKNADLIQGIVSREVITEQEVKLILRRLNGGQKIDLSAIWDNPVLCTSEQSKKAFAWLVNQWKTPAGAERKNNPFGYREQNVLDRFDAIEFAGTYDTGNYQLPYHVPLYNVIGKNGGFQYYINGGEINIVG